MAILRITQALIVALAVTKASVFIVDEARLGLPERLRELDHVADELIDEIVRDRRERRERVERAVAHGVALHRVRAGIVEVVRRARQARDAVARGVRAAGTRAAGVRAAARAQVESRSTGCHGFFLGLQSNPEGIMDCWKA